MLSRALEQLHRAVTSTTTTTDFVRPHPRLTATQLLAIYQESYHLRLQAAVQSDYPALTHYLGTKKLEPLIAHYVRETPSRSYNLDFYSIGFAAFLRTHQSDEAASALADLEAGMTASFMGHDAPPLSLTALTNMDETQLGAAHVIFQQSFCLLTLSHDVESYLAAFKQGAAPRAITETPLHLMLYRHQHEIHRARLSAPEHALLTSLHDGLNFNQAIAETCQTTAITPDALSREIGTWLGQWMQKGCIQSLD